MTTTTTLTSDRLLSCRLFTRLALQLKAFVRYPISYSPPVDRWRGTRAQARALVQAGLAVEVDLGGLSCVTLTRKGAEVAGVALADLDAAVAEHHAYWARITSGRSATALANWALPLQA